MSIMTSRHCLFAIRRSFLRLDLVSQLSVEMGSSGSEGQVDPPEGYRHIWVILMLKWNYPNIDR